MSELATIKPTGTASTLAEIEARLRALNEGAQEVSQLPVVEHSATGLSFHVGPMDRAAHSKWNDLRFFEDRKWRESGGEQTGAAIDRSKSDVILLQNALWTSEGEKITPELAQLLMDSKGGGPSILAILEAATGCNPPRPQLLWELQQMWAANATFLVLVRALKELGLYQVLLDRVAGNEEEQARATDILDKVDAALPLFEALFDVNAQGGQMGIDFSTFGAND